ncbi:phage upper tail fiber protein [Staphylococcus delphini]|uniref:Minor tail protein gp31 C-terminal domain-containing protein n=1 Tax=Staphylococcus delphini TaxID=53344 RepID=A0AAX0QT03_9STAP|nr:hypothetical protein [Staphylococcus delphini]PCF50187.1 hypothetical protein B5C07_08240 [Staphylococcus delphini]PNZ95966.1 hypothetical protein CD148_02220 [Staphylococcus delphini]RIZ56182.1 hypothetical protein CDL68_01185 [Staphylococcus delphini]VED62406.1 phage protein [Staphylococcus delphini]
MAKNLLNELIYVDFKEVSSIQLKQGDTSPILIKLINNAGVKSHKSLKEYAAESSSQRATVYLSTSKNTVVFKQSFEVKNGAIALTINQVLPVGTYFLEILYDGKVYPSANSLSVRINPSADIAQEDIISLETVEAIESNILSKVLPQVQEQIDALLSNQVQKYLAENGHKLRGERGEAGIRGLTGERGADGTSVTISNTETLGNGDKKITFSTGETITIPKGNKGEDGISLTINNIDNDSDPSNVKITFSDNTVISIPKGINGERGERGLKGENGRDGSVVTIDEDTGFWKIDDELTEVKARVEALSDVPMDNVAGLKEKLSLIEQSTEQQITRLRQQELAEINRKIEGVAPQVTQQNQQYVDRKIEELIDSAPENLNTLNEIAQKLQEDSALSASLVKQISSKAATTELEEGLQSKANKQHTHSISDITGLSEQLSQKVESASTESLENYKAEADEKFALKNHNHNGVYAPLSHNHEVQHITGLEERLQQVTNGLDGKDGKSITITNTVTNSDGNVVITFSDNTRVTIPKGAKGDAGATGATGERGLQGAAGRDGKNVEISNIEETSITTGGWGWLGGGTTTKVTRVTFSDGKTADIPHGAKGDTGDRGANGKDGTSISIKSITPTATGNRITFSDNKSIDVKNGTDGRDGRSFTVWTGSQAGYDRLSTKDDNTIYLIKG